ncbi:Bifunctional F420 biosynthesis protein FbiB [Sporomusa rhizae]|uniref:nitroreductase family protein n=1 Tax=Sporomusa rhizae TaxID=357999 RepID=UPI00352AB5F2
MEFFTLVKSRRSVRKYKTEPVSKENILKLLDCANWAPSASNRQPWEFLVVSGAWIKRLSESYRDIVEKFTSNVKIKNIGNIASNKAFLRFASDYGSAPVVVVVLVKKHSDPKEAKADLESASAAMENFVLAAANLGLGTCWMTGPLYDENGLHDILSIQDDKEIVAVTPLGYPEDTPKPVPRKDPNLEKKIIWLE